MKTGLTYPIGVVDTYDKLKRIVSVYTEDRSLTSNLIGITVRYGKYTKRHEFILTRTTTYSGVEYVTMLSSPGSFILPENTVLPTDAGAYGQLRFSHKEAKQLFTNIERASKIDKLVM